MVYIVLITWAQRSHGYWAWTTIASRADLIVFLPDLERSRNLEMRFMEIFIARDYTIESSHLQSRCLPVITLDLHDGRLLVRESNLAFLIEASLLKILDNPAMTVSTRQL